MSATPEATAHHVPDSDRPLAGLRVIEFAAVLAGPATGAFLAELGARVIKVENPRTRGDVTRAWRAAGEDADDDISAYFSCVNWGKQSVGLDLATDDGRELAERLVADADIVLTSFRPGTAARFGLDADTLLARHPRLIVGEISSFGPDDPRPGFDAIVQAETGFTGINGHSPDDAHKMPVALIDLLAAHQLKEGLLLALLQRERTGHGQRVHVSLADAGLASLANQGANWLVAGVVPQPIGNEHPNIVPYGTVFRCIDDRRLVIACGTDAQFRALCRALGESANRLPDDPRFATNAARVAHRAELLPLLHNLFSTHTAADLLPDFHVAGIPAGEVRTVDDALARPAATALTITGTTPDGRELAAIRQAVFAARTATPAPPPTFGSDTDTVLGELADCDATRLADLRTRGVIA